MAKRILCIFVALLMTVTMLAGCAQEKDNDINQKPDSSVQASATPQAATPQASAAPENVAITYATWMSKGEDNPVLEGFMKENPNITVKAEVFDGNKYDELMKTRILSGDAPDVYLQLDRYFDAYVAEGWLMDVTGMEGSKWIKGSKALMERYSKDGKLYGTMLDVSFQMYPVYYNKKYFDKLGIKAPTTLDEFYGICETIKKDGADPVVFGGADAWTINMFSSNIYQPDAFARYGLFENSIADGKIKYSDVCKPIFEMLENMVKQGYVGKASATLKYDQSVQYFVDGKAAMILQGVWFPSLDAVKNAANLELAAFALPVTRASDGRTHILAAGNRVLVMNSSTKKKEASEKFYNYFMKKEVIEKYLTDQSGITNLPGIEVDMNPVLKAFFAPLSDETKYAIEFKMGDYIMPTIVDTTRREALQNMLAGSAAKDELARIDTAYESNKDQVKKK